ncbi:DNA/RNA polymerase [Exidia glandulosa HHB12029]|uniref:DNA/RNA polymerase n=1 Tax=Exidia glandulosa HHB12029 TaxID=1314781 RepID=A0A165I352_EXIGL|nr:DNA/RNA polymerase [Exidia glandulosa HHB12029]
MGSDDIFDDYVLPSAVNASLSAYPLPRPPASEFENVAAMQTIASHPELFKIVTPINVERFKELLRDHPNRPFVESVLTGLTDGFWPLADTRSSGAPDSADYSAAASWDDPEKLQFFQQTRDEEVGDERWSADFGSALLPGMYSSPVFAVPKPHSNKMRMVVHHSYGAHSLNSFISRDGVSTTLDSMHTLGRFLRIVRSGTGLKLRIFKSDVSKAYRRMPAHALWQIKQVVSVLHQRFVDRCCNFGTKSSGDIFFAFMSLVLWIAQEVQGIDYLCNYVDDCFSFDEFNALVLYPPYARLMPRKQAALLSLWDDIGLPHSDDKQLHGCPLTVIGFDVDPNAMTIRMPDSSRTDLLSEIAAMLSSRRQPLRTWQSLIGYANWALNVYPLLRPGLAAAYKKITGKNGKSWTVYLNHQVSFELRWFSAWLTTLPGIQLLDADNWGPSHADLILVCDASLSGLGFWSPDRLLGFHTSRPDPSILFNESLCVLSALVWASAQEQRPARLAVFTDSLDSVWMFRKLKAGPLYNPILLTACDLQLRHGISLRVFHLPGAKNGVADALSRGKLDLAAQIAPGLRIAPFLPPTLLSPSPDATLETVTRTMDNGSLTP